MAGQRRCVVSRAHGPPCPDPLRLGTFNPKTVNRTEPSQTKPNFWFFRFLVSVLVPEFANFGVQCRLWFLDSSNRTTEGTEFIYYTAPLRPTATLHLGLYRPNPTLQLQPISQTQEPYPLPTPIPVCLPRSSVLIKK
jgi:hypothetical protein